MLLRMRFSRGCMLERGSLLFGDGLLELERDLRQG